MMKIPFGIKIAATIFQKTLKSLLCEFKKLCCHRQDIVITGKDFESLKAVPRKLQQVFDQMFLCISLWIN